MSGPPSELVKISQMGVGLLALGALGAWIMTPLLFRRPVPPSNQTLTVAPSTFEAVRPTPPKYLLIEFMDYQCPPCRASDSLVRSYVAKYDRVMDFKRLNFPLNFHKVAKRAAIAAEIAKDSGKFDLVDKDLIGSPIRNDSDVDAILLKNHIRTQSDYWTDNSVWSKRLDSQVNLAKLLSVNATPTFVLISPTLVVTHLGTLSNIDGMLR